MAEVRLKTDPKGIRSARAFAAVTLSISLATLVAGCAYKPAIPPSEGHLTRESVPPKDDKQNILPPVTTSTYVPPPKARPKAPTYSVVVHEVPVKELLLALSRDTKENIDVHPGLQGLVSLNAIDETLPSILDRVSRQVNMRYRQEGKTMVVTPDTPYIKTYKVDYVNMTRDTTSTIAVSGQISGASSTGGANGPGGGASNTSVNTISKNNFWEMVQQNIQSILTSTRTLTQSAEERQAQAQATRAAREERLAQADAVARAGQNAPALFDKAFGSGPPSDVKQDIVVNPITGTVTLMATEREHQLIQQYLDAVASSSQRQVLIEATIAEVTLSDQYQAGINWKRLPFAGAGFAFTQNLITAAAFGTAVSGGGTGLTATYSNNTSNTGDLSTTVQLLEQFGNTRVLSSPKLMAMNNQTALLKVVDNVVYFQVQSSISQGTQGAGNLQSITTTPQTVAVGFIMSMTPQINDSGVITLSVRPTITRVQLNVPDPNPLLVIPNFVPQIQVREMESVLQLVSGQTAILGGLMQDNTARNKDQIPGLGNLPRVGELFQYRKENVVKTELVIFIRPVIVKNPSVDSDQLRHLRRFLPEIDKTGQNP